jgi:hypothetical protein
LRISVSISIELATHVIREVRADEMAVRKQVLFLEAKRGKKG